MADLSHLPAENSIFDDDDDDAGGPPGADPQDPERRRYFPNKYISPLLGYKIDRHRLKVFVFLQIV